jgi:hypothetical protein
MPTFHDYNMSPLKKARSQHVLSLLAATMAEQSVIVPSALCRDVARRYCVVYVDNFRSKKHGHPFARRPTRIIWFFFRFRIKNCNKTAVEVVCLSRVSIHAIGKGNLQFRKLHTIYMPTFLSFTKVCSDIILF